MGKNDNNNDNTVLKVESEFKKRGVIAVYDVRKFEKYFPETESMRLYRKIIEKKCPAIAGIDSKKFTEIEALIYAGNGVRFYYPSEVRPTPWLSYHTWTLHRTLKDDVYKIGNENRTLSGVVNSSSHNLPDNNGIKFYQEEGGQAPPAQAQEIMDAGNSASNVKLFEGTLDEAKEKGLVVYLDDKELENLDDAYFRAVFIQVEDFLPRKDRSAVVAYHTLNGTGDKSLGEALKLAGFEVVRDEEDIHDGQFPTAFANTPNPEVEKSFDMPIAVAVKRDIEFFKNHNINVEVNSDFRGFIITKDNKYDDIINDLLCCQIALVTDPDADRGGLAIKKINKLSNEDIEVKWISANDNDEIAIILFRYILEKYQKLGRLYKGKTGICVSTVVSNPLEHTIVKSIAEKYDIDIKMIAHTVGFKHTGQIITNIKNREYEGLVGGMMKTENVDLDKAYFIASFEEGEGGLIGSEGSIDKDAAPNGVLLAMLASEMQAKGKTVYDYLIETYKKYGYSKIFLEPIVMDGADGFAMIQEIMKTLRDPKQSLTEIAGYQIASIEDLLDKYPTDINAEKTDRDILIFTLDKFIMPDGRDAINAVLTIRPSGTEPKIKLTSSVTAEPLGLDISDREFYQHMEVVTQIARKLLDDLLLKSYEASGACYNGIKIPEDDNKRMQLIRLYINMPLRQKLGLYFPLTDRVAKLAEDVRNKQIDIKQAAKEVHTKLQQLHYKEGLEYIASAFNIHLESQIGKLGSEIIDIQRRIVFDKPDIDDSETEDSASSTEKSIESADDIMRKSNDQSNEDLINIAKKSFERLTGDNPILKKYLSGVVKNISQWLTDGTFIDYNAALKELILLSQTDDEITNELFDSFWRIIPFGTGGRRWRVGIGPNRMNPYIIALTAQGHVDYLLANNSGNK